MKKLLALLLLSLLPLTVLADAPPAFSVELQTMDADNFALHCESALANTPLAGSTVAVHENGEPALTRDEYDAFAVMYRPDGLMMLCHFLPDGDDMALNWHNDLLLSHYQDIALSMEGAVWSGGSIPLLQVSFDTLYLTLDQGDGTRLTLKCVGFTHLEPWRVTEMRLDASPDGTSFRTSLILPEDCLAEDIYLENCEPNNWRGNEEEDWYGW